MSSPWAWQCGPPPYCTSGDSSEVDRVRTWRRPFWSSELTFAILAVFSPRNSDMLLSTHLNLPPNTELSFNHIRTATRALRWSQPSIASTIAFPPFTSRSDFNYKEGVFVYRSPASEEEVNTWLDEVVFDKSAYLAAADGNLDRAFDLLRDELGSATAPHTQWLFKVYYIGDPATNKHGILVHTGHTLTDGVGTFESLDLLLHELARVVEEKEEREFTWGEEVARLSQAVPDRAEPMPPIPVTLEHPVCKALMQAAMTPPIKYGIPVIHPNAVPDSTGTILKSLPAPVAENLRLVARTHGCSIFSTIFAASYLCLLALNPPTAGDSDINAGIMPSPFDLRSKYLAGGASVRKDRSKWQISSAYASGAFVLQHLERFADSKHHLQDVWVLAREVQEQVTTQADCMSTATQWYPVAIERMMMPFFGAKDPLAGTKSKIVTVSSLGVMDDSLSSTYPVQTSEPLFSISKPVFTVVHPGLPAGNGGGLFLPYTWQGTLFLSISFPSAYMGTLEEQKEHDKAGEPTLYRYMETLADMLQKLAEPRKLPN